MGDRYEDRGVIGRGGTASVRRRFDRELERLTAHKLLDPMFVSNDEVVDRFVREARLTGRLEHPNIVPVHDLVRTDRGGWSIHMKLVQGHTLAQLVDRDGEDRLEPDRLGDYVEVLIKVCDALAYAHHEGVVHRDVKPANVMVGAFGEVYLMDWGVARVPGHEDPPGRALGTPAFMAPEQLRDAAELDGRTDVFGVGATLWFALTGRAPYAAPYQLAAMAKAMQCRAPTAREAGGDAVPPALSRIVEKAMARDPADRFASVSDLREALERFLRGGWHLDEVTFPAGTLIVREGEPGVSAYVVRKGTCRAWTRRGGERMDLRDMGPGAVFGETAIFAGSLRTATVEAVTDVTVQVVTRDSLTHSVGLHTWVGPFVRALAERFLEVEARLHDLEAEPQQP